MKKTLIILVIIVIGFGLWFSATKDRGKLGSALSDNIFTSGGIEHSTQIVSSTAATTTFGRNLNRQYGAICNDAGSAVFLNFRPDTANAASTTAGTGYRIPTNACYEINTTNLYQDTVWVITATTATSTISGLEK